MLLQSSVYTSNLQLMRVLGRIRLSRATDESTSAERQREVIEQWAAANDHTVVGWAEDLDISGAVDPFDTPALGPWLEPDRAGGWDILCAWKLDRLGRDSIRLNKLFGWAIDTNHTIVSCTEGIDLSTPVGRLIANVIAFLAEGEREAISERTKASQKKLREVGRWGGGKPVFGYEAVQRKDGAGWELQPDPHAASMVDWMMSKVLEGRSTQSIATELTEAGELTPADRLRQRAGKPIKSGVWSTNTVRTVLRSKTLLGHSTHDGKTVRDPSGQPVMIGPALVTPERFAAVQAALEGSSLKVTNRSAGASPLLGILICPICDRAMHLRQNHSKARGKTYRYYQCLGGKGSGGGGSAAEHQPHILKADQAEELLEQFVLETIGDKPEKEPTWIPASDNTTELASVRAAIEELSVVYADASSSTVKAVLLKQITALDNRAAALEETPPQEGRWDYTPTGRTNREAWQSMNDQQRREWVMRMKFQFTVDSEYQPNFSTPLADFPAG